MNIATRITELKNLRGLSSYKLSKLSGVSQTYIREIESGSKQPTVEILEKILSALNISWGEFFRETDSPEVSPELRRLLDSAKKITPEQLAAVQNLLNTIKSD